MKYKFEKDSSVRTNIYMRKEVADQIKEIVERENATYKSVINGLLSVAVKEYWEEREVKKKMKRVKPKGITASVKRSKPILKTGTSYCQFSRCPDKGQNYLTKNMFNYDKLVFCSESCVAGFKHDQEN